MAKSKMFNKAMALIVAIAMIVSLLPAFANIANASTNDGKFKGDGTYEVNVYLWHESADKGSMAKGVLKEKAKIEVVEGIKTMFIETTTLDMMGLKGAADKISIRQNDGSYLDAKVCAMENKLPSKFSFKLPHTEEYIGVKLNVLNVTNEPYTQLMAPNARIKIDYNTLKKVKEPETKPEVKPEVKPEIKPEEKPTTKPTEPSKKPAKKPTKKPAKVNSYNNVLKVADGTYKVPVALYNATKDQPSMAKDSFLTNATVTVNGNKATMTIYTRQMIMGNITASLQTLKVFDDNGKYKNATVVKRDSNNNPTAFTFDLPHNHQFIKVAVNPKVAIMGNSDIDARIKVDYSKMTKVKSTTNVNPGAALKVVSKSKTPKTGDEAQIMVLVLAMMFSVGMGAYVYKRK